MPTKLIFTCFLTDIKSITCFGILTSGSIQVFSSFSYSTQFHKHLGFLGDMGVSMSVYFQNTIGTCIVAELHLKFLDALFQIINCIVIFTIMSKISEASKEVLYQLLQYLHFTSLQISRSSVA